MENFVTLAIPALLLLALVRMMLVPMKLGYKLILNSASGFVCLWLLNWVSGLTGIFFPINVITVLVAGFLGLPGMGALALVQVAL